MFGTKLVEDLGAGWVVADASDKGGVPSEAGDGDHGGGDHASALFDAPADRGAPLGRWDLAEEKQIIDAREADPEDARRGVPDGGWGGRHEARG